MNIKLLVLGLAIAASLGSTAKATNLILNGRFENPGGTSSVNFYCNSPGSCGNPYNSDIPNWDVHGASGSTTYNVFYIYDDLTDTTLPASMPPSYYSCTPALGFVSGNACSNPDGAGHFINLDGDPGFAGAISQAIPVGGLNGLVQGQQYRLTFGWAVVERVDEDGGMCGNFLEVSLGDEHFSTPTPSVGVIHNPFPAEGFSGCLLRAMSSCGMEEVAC